MKIKVTIGLCVKNGAKTVKTAFDSISIQDYPHEFMKVVIVVDGNDNTLTLAFRFVQEIDMSTFVTSSTGKGLGTARQIVLDNAEGDYILWVDDDYVLTKDYVRKQVEFIEKSPKVGAVKGFYNDFSTKHAVNILNFEDLIFVRSLNYLGTGGSIFRLKALDEVGGFDTRIKGAGEDIDVSSRIRKSGWKLAFNNIAGFHKKYSSMTMKALWKREFGYGYGNHFLLHKNKDQQILKQYFPPFALFAGIKVSCTIYRITNLKKVFLFAVLHSFSMIASSAGFASAHLDGYGHDK